MSQDKSGKNEKPTANRLKKARQDGQVPKSKDITSTAGLTALIVYLVIAGPFMWSSLLELFIHASSSVDKDPDVEMGLIIDHVYEVFWKVAVPPAIIAAFVGVLSNIGQFGFLFVTKPITPSIEKINPIAGFKRIFGLNNLVETLKSIVKVLVLAVLFFLIIRAYLQDLVNIIYCDLQCAVEVGKEILALLIGIAILSFTVIAIMDFSYQKWQHIKNNMMSLDEVKRDRKMTDGDPIIKQRLRQEMRASVQDSLADRVKKTTIYFRPSSSDYIIGLFYKQGQTPLPMIIVMEKNIVAEKVKDTALTLKIPVIEHNDLAQQLLEKGKLNNYIPSDMIQLTAKTMAKYVKLA